MVSGVHCTRSVCRGALAALLKCPPLTRFTALLQLCGKLSGSALSGWGDFCAFGFFVAGMFSFCPILFLSLFSICFVSCAAVFAIGPPLGLASTCWGIESTLMKASSMASVLFAWIAFASSAKGPLQKLMKLLVALSGMKVQVASGDLAASRAASSGCGV